MHLRKLAASFDRLAAKRKTSIVLSALLIVALRLAILPFLGPPEPMAPDEFSQILAAQTFANGRWTNPPHPLWIHFEAVHIIQQPTYASKYPPGPPLIMALGILLTGHPWTGVLISAALMCGAICWMLQGWVPARWALAGSLLAVARYSLHHYWINSYWGGAFAAFGGALIVGALPRILRGGGRSAVIAMGVGMAVVVSARPFEGVVLSLIPGILILRWWLRDGPKLARRRFRMAIVPIAAILALAAIPYAYYNYRVAGSPLRLPYTIHTATYEPVPHFLWQSQRDVPEYHHKDLREYHHPRDTLQNLRRPQSIAWRAVTILGLPRPDVPVRTLAHPKTLTNLIFGVCLLLSVLLVARDPKMRIPLLIFALMMVALLQETYFYDHYAAPMAGLTFLLVIQGLRRVAVSRRWLWRVLPLALVLAAGAAVVLYSAIAVRLLVEPPDYIKIDRPHALAHIGKHPGRHLVFVRFIGPPGMPAGEWVYNEPDIDRARIVLARDMGPKNSELIEYFSGRQVWTVCAGLGPARIYRGESCSSATAHVR